MKIKKPIQHLRGNPDDVRQSIPASFSAVIVLLAIVSGFVWLTFERNDLYEHPVTLWEDTAGKSPGKARTYNNLGKAYYHTGRMGDAIAAFTKALELRPNHVEARFSLGMTYVRQ